LPDPPHSRRGRATEPSALAKRRILGPSSIQGAAEVRCRNRDGRAAILQVKGPGGCLAATLFFRRLHRSTRASVSFPSSEIGKEHDPGGGVFLKVALLLLLAWLLGIIGLYDVGSLVHVCCSLA
jgi:hypothetical protein